MNNDALSYSFIILGYRDYIAARFLLNNNYCAQGLTLASIAVEKYLKAILIFNGKLKKVHLDNLEKIKAIMSDCYYDITQNFDARFMNLLGKAYKARYYDSLTSPISIGFFVNQFIGELDYIIAYIENNVIINVSDENGKIINTPYKRAIEEQNRDLFYNNYLFNGLTKKEHMEMPDIAFGIYYDPLRPAGEIMLSSKKIVNEYDGTIWEINFKIE